MMAALSLSSSLPTSSSFSSPIPLLQFHKFPGTHHLHPHLIRASLQSPVEENPEADYGPVGEGLKTNNNKAKSKKKKQQLRPSFYDQTIERWSVRISSQRTKFPWQQSMGGERQVVGGECKELGDRYASAAADGGSLPPANRVVSAPWAHGGATANKTQFHPQINPTQIIYSSDAALIPSDKGVDSAQGAHIIYSSGDAQVPSEKGAGSAQGAGERRGAARFGEVGRRLEDGVQKNHFGQIFSNQNLENSSSFSDSITDESGNGRHLNSEDGFLDSSLTSGIESREHENEGIGLITVDGLRRSSSHLRKSDFSISLNDGNGNAKSAPLLPWQREDDSAGKEREREKSNTELAERMIPEPELRRLRNAALRMKERTKVGSAGVTEALVESIKDKWKETEVVKLRFEGQPAINMRRTHEILESKTGGLVIWRSGSSVVLYRGMSYKLPCVQSFSENINCQNAFVKSSKDSITTDEANFWKLEEMRTMPNSVSSLEEQSNALISALDIDSLLDELGPRFRDWAGREPLPVDADLLPRVIPGYKPPFRFLPYKVKVALWNSEMTYLRRLARSIPPHFALGRNREHHGLAQAMVKLWEKSLIAKIAIKRGVLNTCNDRMAEEIRRLTGGILLSRNKEFIVFYRGNDFLTPPIAKILIEREKLANVRQEEEDQARQRASDLIILNTKVHQGPHLAGTLAETIEAKLHWANEPSKREREIMMTDEILSKHKSLIRYMERKLALAQEKVRKAEKALAKVQEFLEPTDLPNDLETVTDEERFLFRKMGLKMRSFLSLGRRGVFDGTIENMHLNWKYRELVKILVKGKSFALVKHIAVSLEAESRGVLISLDKTTKGYAIIIYRGKNYQRPHVLRPRNLLTRRQALARSIELQRREALKHHISNLQEKIQIMKTELEQTRTKQISDEDGSTEIYNDVFSDDGNLEEEGEEAYLETYEWDSEDDFNREDDDSASV